MLNDFRGEVWINTHEDILNAMIKANSEPVDGGYGVESYAARAAELMQKNFKDKIYTTFAMNGTAANIMTLKAMLDRWDSVLCTEQTHIDNYEAGAFEFNLGNKILTIPSPDGKITVDLIKDLLKIHINHKYIPKVITLAQPTELGTVYTPDELKDICDYAHANGMYVYLDGARLFTAIAALDTDIKTMIEYPDIDAFTFGGTKAGAMFGEMIIFRREEFARHLPYSQKQSLQHLSKSKFLSVQLIELLKDGLWFKNGKIATDMAKLLEKKLLEKGIKTAYKVESNLLFCIIDHERVAKITEKYSLHYWEEDKDIIRLVTTHLTTEEQIDNLISLL